MSTHVTILSPASGAVTVSPQASCGYLYEHRDGDAPELAYNATTATPAPPDPSWGAVPYLGIVAENVNLAASAVDLTFDEHFAVAGGNALSIPSRTYAHIWLIPQDGQLTEVSRAVGDIPPAAESHWTRTRAAMPIVKGAAPLRVAAGAKK